MRKYLLASLAVIGFMNTPSAGAQDWPTRPVTMVVPFAAGGGTDVTARIIAPRLGEVLGQQVIIENLGGAGGMIGSNRVAKAAPDGSTLLFGAISVLAFIPSLYKEPLYNAATDFEPVALVADGARVLVTRKDFPANTLLEFVTYTKANHAKMQYGSAGTGSGPHVCSLLLDAAMGVTVLHIAYKGGGPAMIDLVAGRLDYLTDQISSALPQIAAGKVKAIATLSASRVPGLGALATAQEQGLANVSCREWSALVFPNGTPAKIVRRLAQAASDALDTPAVSKRLEEAGIAVPPKEDRTTEYLAKLIPSEIEKWGKLIKASGVRAE